MSEHRPWTARIDPTAAAVIASLPDLDPSPDPEAWRDEALCAQANPDEWYQEKGGSTATAKKVCRRCPVQAACLEYALEHDEHWGVWGGKSERERRHLKRGQVAA